MFMIRSFAFNKLKSFLAASIEKNVMTSLYWPDIDPFSLYTLTQPSLLYLTQAHLCVSWGESLQRKAFVAELHVSCCTLREGETVVL